ncbi:MAG: FeoA family protein [Cyanobacteria bacterium P01_E01_bin.6]
MSFVHQNNPLDREENWRFTYIGGTDSCSNHRDEHDEYRSPPNGSSPIRLSEAMAGTVLKIVGYSGNDENMQNLANIGISPGTDVHVISHTPSGSVIISVDEKQIGFGANVAAQIHVVAPGTLCTETLSMQNQR